MKLGSLFDGSGTAPLAAAICGIEPTWASEIEPYPIMVTTARFPQMKHLGSILDVRGEEIEPVDIICGGSPCQDLSVAGKQAGIHNGERSRLFFEMVRIIREMRESTDGEYPKYVIWENVPGALSSNNGNDFHAVLQGFADIAEAGVHVPRPACKGKTDRLDWKNAGSVVGDGWSIAWRVVDAQYWGVPQRRRRIYLILDLADERAGEILFERDGMSGDPESCEEAREKPSDNDAGGAGGSDRAWLSFHLQQDPFAQGSMGYCEECSPTLRAGDVRFVVYDTRGNGDGSTVPTLTGDHQNSVTDYTAVCICNGQLHNISMAEQMNTLDCMHDQQAVLTSGKPPRRYIVRRLTPLECCRLQGFPDGWGDIPQKESMTNDEALFWESVLNTRNVINGKPEKRYAKASILKWYNRLHTDSAEYKMWGNGMALPNMLFVMRRIAEHGGIHG